MNLLRRAAMVLWGALLPAIAAAATSDVPRFVGSAVCASCHASQASAWQGSHHQLALQPATRSSVLAPFGGETFRAGGVTSTFSKRGDRFVVRTDGPDGRLRDYEVVHTIGVSPLQQYLVPMPDGSLHALAIAWDARPRQQGGQRWFHLQAADPQKPGDELHWTGRQMNASATCIECHVTGFRKNYDVAVRRYASKWAEGEVGCEACHGAGARHVEWARLWKSDPRLVRQVKDMGLQVRFDERRGASWQRAAAAATAQREPPATATGPRKEVNACARCHSHRGRIAEDAGPQSPLLDSFRPSVVEPGLHYDDGQMRAEVYDHTSFLQSRMHARGVTCSDCHDPHSQKLRAPGNAVCLQCHAAPTFDSPVHHFHRLGTSGAQCVACHMPSTNYMTLHARHDHFIRVPNPAQSQAVGSPDACTQCHSERPQSWAIAWTRRWYPGLERRRSMLAETLQSMDRDDWDVVSRLSTLFADPAQTAVTRASVLQRMPAAPSSWLHAARQLQDPEPLVRRAAVEALRDAPPQQRAGWLMPVLDDTVRGVRIEAARTLASSRDGLPAAARAKLDAVLREWEDTERFNADRPEAWNNIAMLHADLGEWAKAEAALREALVLAPAASATALNLADVYRAQGRESEAESTIRSVVRREPRSAPAQHALGLALLRQRKSLEALDALRRANALDPSSARHAWVLALALRQQGRPRDALMVLEPALQRHPRDVSLRQAAIAAAREAGDPGAQSRHAALLARALALEPTPR